MNDGYGLIDIEKEVWISGRMECRNCGFKANPFSVPEGAKSSQFHIMCLHCESVFSFNRKNLEDGTFRK